MSVLWGIADEMTVRQLGEAHDDAVEAALGYMEREACRARRGKGGAIQVHGSGFVAAAFRHRASRAGDPLLHTYVVTGNLTQGPDDRGPRSTPVTFTGTPNPPGSQSSSTCQAAIVTPL